MANVLVIIYDDANALLWCQACPARLQVISRFHAVRGQERQCFPCAATTHSGKLHSSAMVHPKQASSAPLRTAAQQSASGAAVRLGRRPGASTPIIAHYDPPTWHIAHPRHRRAGGRSQCIQLCIARARARHAPCRRICVVEIKGKGQRVGVGPQTKSSPSNASRAAGRGRRRALSAMEANAGSTPRLTLAEVPNSSAPMDLA